jgi:hypothetical protein
MGIYDLLIINLCDTTRDKEHIITEVETRENLRRIYDAFLQSVSNYMLRLA